MLKCSDTESVLQILREHLDPSATDEVSARLSLLYLFTTNLSMDDDDTLIDVLRDFRWFHISFTSTGWFGTDSVYLVPSKAAVLTDPVTRIREILPEYPAFDTVPERAVPYVTIGKRTPLSELKVMEAEALNKLPVCQVCTTVELWNGPPPGTGRWQWHCTYRLGI